MLVLPSDHLIQHTALFLDSIGCAACIAEDGENIVTLGIAPTYPETGYGYILLEEGHACYAEAYAVLQFTEKPNAETAKMYVASKRYLWNSGMFLWKCSTLMKNIRAFLPTVADGLERIQASIGAASERDVVRHEFAAFPSISIDYGIMEKARSIFAVPGTFGWDDVGSWLAIERLNKAGDDGNILSGDVSAIDASNCTVMGAEKYIAIVGAKDLIVVDANDALLICAKDATQNVKKVIEHLHTQKRTALL